MMSGFRAEVFCWMEMGGERRPIRVFWKHMSVEGGSPFSERSVVGQGQLALNKIGSSFMGQLGSLIIAKSILRNVTAMFTFD